MAFCLCFIYFLNNVTPQQWQEQINIYHNYRNKIQEIMQKKLYAQRDRRGIMLDNLKTYRRISDQALRIVTKAIENKLREKLGFKKVGEQWINETLLYYILCEIFPNFKIYKNYRPSWMNGLELDVYIPDKKLAFEYQGQQHFNPVKIFGGKEALNKVKRRDKLKEDLCIQLGIVLIKITYKDNLSRELVMQILQENGIV